MADEDHQERKTLGRADLVRQTRMARWPRAQSGREWARLLSPLDDLRPRAKGGARGTPVVLRDGGRITIRRLQIEDRPAVRDLLGRLSPESIAQRLHSGGHRITDGVLDGVTAGHVLVAELDGMIVALASFHPLPHDNEAEAAILVDDAHHGRGIGLALGASLYCDAQAAGIEILHAGVQGSNRAMLKLLRRLNLPMTHTWAHGVVEIEIEVPEHDALGGVHRAHERKSA